jgi:hypothetical protein
MYVGHYYSFEEFKEESSEKTLLGYYKSNVNLMKEEYKHLSIHANGMPGDLAKLWEAESILEILKKRHSLGHLPTSTTQPS